MHQSTTSITQDNMQNQYLWQATNYKSILNRLESSETRVKSDYDEMRKQYEVEKAELRSKYMAEKKKAFTAMEECQELKAYIEQRKNRKMQELIEKDSKI